MAHRAGEPFLDGAATRPLLRQDQAGLFQQPQAGLLHLTRPLQRPRVGPEHHLLGIPLDAGLGRGHQTGPGGLAGFVGGAGLGVDLGQFFNRESVVLAPLPGAVCQDDNLTMQAFRGPRLQDGLLGNPHQLGRLYGGELGNRLGNQGNHLGTPLARRHPWIRPVGAGFHWLPRMGTRLPSGAHKLGNLGNRT
ncbi:hypothetical protein GALL_530100 [mine drainage metagenome]|uniref:Uncharacterized protein n=1 Tax=mine drainage metagenome TaxID=410659 RepID=A0A1J5P413_9ZZZZ